MIYDVKDDKRGLYLDLEKENPYSLPEKFYIHEEKSNGNGMSKEKKIS